MKGNMQLVSKSEKKATYNLTFERQSTPRASEEPYEPGEFHMDQQVLPDSGDMQQSPIRELLGKDYKAQVIKIYNGEDVAEKIMSFFQDSPRMGFIMSATGLIYSTIISHSGQNIYYEGRFDIVSLNGLYKFSESNGQRSGIDNLTVCLASTDCRVFGGVVAGPLLAATPVQVVVGSFLVDDHEEE